VLKVAFQDQQQSTFQDQKRNADNLRGMINNALIIDRIQATEMNSGNKVKEWKKTIP
jgi:hypothetical protein